MKESDCYVRRWVIHPGSVGQPSPGRAAGGLIGALLIAALASFGCGGAAEGNTSRGARTVIDEGRGTYDGAGLGQDAAAVGRRLGAAPNVERTRRRISLPLEVPLDEGETLGLPAPQLPREATATQRSRTRPLNYRRVTLDLVPGVGVYAVSIVDPGASTRRGARIGMSLKRVRELYPEAHCGRRAIDSEDPSSTLPFCAATTGRRRYTWFGNDPVMSITLTSEPLVGLSVPAG